MRRSGEATFQGKPFLGICLGMQLLADHHDEGKSMVCGSFAGSAADSRGPKIPQMGWNQVSPALRDNLAIFDGYSPESYFYFCPLLLCRAARSGGRGRDDRLWLALL